MPRVSTPPCSKKRSSSTATMALGAHSPIRASDVLTRFSEKNVAMTLPSAATIVEVCETGGISSSVGSSS